MLTISLNEIRAHGPCKPGWEKLLKFMGKTKADDERFPFKVLLDSNGLSDTLWALRCVKAQVSKLLAVAFAQEVERYMTDERSTNAIRAAHLYVHGELSRKKMVKATEDAWSAADAAYADVVEAATDAAEAAADAAEAAADAAEAAYAAEAAAYAVDVPDAMPKRQEEWIIAICDQWEEI